MFDGLDRFDEHGYCAAYLNKKKGFIDKTGNWIIQPVIDVLDEDSWGVDIFEIDEDKIHQEFENLVGVEKVFLSPNLPLNKIKNFSKHFNESYFDKGEIFVYYDHTIWGKGDNGFLILKYNTRFYVFIRFLSGRKTAFCIEHDGEIPGFEEASFTDKGLQITIVTNDGDQEIIETNFTNETGKALFRILDSCDYV